jgi:hypothetical protein
VPVRRTAWLAVLLLLPSLPGQAATASHRVVTVGYSTPAGVTTGDGATLFGNPTATGIARADEDAVTVSATDSGGAVALVVDVTPAGGATTRRVTCIPLVVPVRSGTTVQVSPVAGRCTDGHVSSPRGGHVTLSFHRRPPTHPVTGAPPAMRWAVVIGIGDYAGNTHSTVGGTGDATVVRKALLAAGWRSDHIRMLTGRAATAAGIRDAFAWLAARSGPRTFSLLHFSGHVCIASRGPCARGHTYLWGYDNRFIPETEVRSRMARVKGYSWLDVAGCEGGAFDLHSSSRLFTASSRANETSYENPDWRQSIWTGLVWDRGFMKGLADDRGVARRATIGEMTAYGKRQAPPMTASGEKGSQHPVVVGGSGRWTLYAPPGG